MADRSPGQVPRIPPGTKGTKNPDMPGEKTANWPQAPGPKGPMMNKVGWSEVKAFAAQDLADDKSMKLGGGGRFAKLKASIAAKGNVSDPAAVAAAIGRKKYGAAKMAKMAAAGRK